MGAYLSQDGLELSMKVKMSLNLHIHNDVDVFMVCVDACMCVCVCVCSRYHRPEEGIGFPTAAVTLGELPDVGTKLKSSGRASHSRP